MLHNILLTIFFIISIILILLIMFQQENNNDIKSSFIGGPSNNLFTPQNSVDSSINKIIKILAAFFIFISLILNNFNNAEKKINKWESLNKTVQEKNIYKSNNKILKNINKDIPD